MTHARETLVSLETTPLLPLYLPLCPSMSFCSTTTALYSMSTPSVLLGGVSKILLFTIVITRTLPAP